MILGIAAFTNVFGRFLHRELAGIPLNVFLQYIVPILAIPLLIAFKYGKPRRYLFDFRGVAHEAADLLRHWNGTLSRT